MDKKPNYWSVIDSFYSLCCRRVLDLGLSRRRFRADGGLTASVADAVGQTLTLKTTVRFFILPILSFSAVCSFLPIKAAVLNHPDIVSFSVFGNVDVLFGLICRFFLNCLM